MDTIITDMSIYDEGTLLTSEWFTWLNWGMVIILTILFFIYCFSKEGRDEHGKAIIGSASFYGVIAFIIFTNILCYYMFHIIENIALFANSIRLVYNGYMLVMLIAIAILRKIR